jgi:hypothetical protein
MNESNKEAKWVLGLTAVASLMVALGTDSSHEPPP